MEVFWNGIGKEKHFLGFVGPPFRETGIGKGIRSWKANCDIAAFGAWGRKCPHCTIHMHVKFYHDHNKNRIFKP